MVKVRNMKSPAGNTVPNQFVIALEDGEYFQSWHRTIAWRGNDGAVLIDTFGYHYSPTTYKYLKAFFGFASTEEADDTINEWWESGKLVFTDLNK